jgi:hypothetical protein
MKDWRLVVGKLSEIVKSSSTITSAGEKAGFYAAARVLLADLEEAVKEDDSNAYALEKIGNAKWHIGAAFGFDIGNENSPEEHRVWAYAALNSLKSTLESHPSEAD